MSPPAERASAATPSEARSRRFSWEAYSVVVATIVGLLSLGVAAYTAYTLRAQTRAQVYPYLQFIDLGLEHKFVVHNKGVGPAFVKSMRVEVDGRAVTSWKDFWKATHVTMQGVVPYSNVNRTAVSANETLVALQFDEPADFLRYEAIDPKSYRIHLCYCSVLDECWTVLHTADSYPTPQPAAVCKVDPDNEFKQ